MSVATGESYLLGFDFGTDSVRVLVVDAANGAEIGTAVRAYPRWAEGRYCEPRENRFRQHPLDYVESMEAAANEAIAAAGAGAAKRVRGIAIDTTGSTPCFADARGRPLALDPSFTDDPDAMFILWKDHTSVGQAERINALARGWGGEDFSKYEGGVYSSEWFWAKALRVVETNPRVAAASRTIVEHCDWMPAVLCGATDLQYYKRSRCAAGHKAMWHESWGGYPPASFLSLLHPRLAELAATLGASTYTADKVFGRLSAEWATRLGLGESVDVAVGAFDAHVGAVGGSVAPGTLLKIMGTSTCDIMVGPASIAAKHGAAIDAPKGGPFGDEKRIEKRAQTVSAGGERLVRGICGQVDGSVIPGWIGYEAGQSAFGDLFAWFRGLLAWPFRNIAGLAARDDVEGLLLPALEARAAEVDPASSGLVALDWMNGRRSPDANQALTGAITGIGLGTDAPMVYRALIEAAAFGSRAIVERLRDEGVAIERVAAVGGVARKSPLVMQISADVLGMDIAVSASDQSCALGAAMFASVAAGIHADVRTAQAAMAAPTERTYKPNPRLEAVYDALYERYQALGAFVESTTKTGERK